jgi:hypothetical protein
MTNNIITFLLNDIMSKKIKIHNETQRTLLETIDKI